MWRFRQDLKYAVRQLRKSPGFAFAAIVTLGLGIGANTAVFSVVYTLLLKSLPFQQAERIVSILETHPQATGGAEATYPDFRDWESQQKSFEQLGAYSTLNPESVALNTGGRSEQVRRVLASGNYFSVLGISPLLGRAINERDEKDGADHVGVISTRAWEQVFGRDPNVVGRIVHIDGASFTIVGVLRTGQSFPAEGEIWLPLSLMDKPTQASRVWHSVRVIGRLRNGVSLDRARADMNAIAARIAESNPATNRNVGVQLDPIREKLIGGYRPAILSVMLSVLLVLFMACANVGGLLMVRATAQKKETAIRRTLGASRARLFSQHLAQTMVICLLGGILGTILAWACLPFLIFALSHKAGFDASLIESIHISPPILLFTLGTCVGTSMLFGVLPILKIPRSLAASLLGGDRGHTARGGLGRHALISSEIALAVVVLFLSALTIRSFRELLAVDPGYRTEGLLTFEVSLPGSQYQPGTATVGQFFGELFVRIARLPGVVSAASTTQEPLAPSLAMTRFLIQGAPPLAPGAFPMAQIRYVSPRFFETMGLHLEDGRIFTQKDMDDQAAFFVVNETFAKRYLADRKPVGSHILIGVLSPKPTSVPVVGVVTDAHEVGIEMAPPPEIFLPGFGLHEVVLVRTTADPASMVSAMRAIVHEINPDQPIYHVQTAEQSIADSIALQKMTASILAVFAGVALLLAMIGIYGVLAYSITQRTREIGVRMAVGAQKMDIVRVVLYEAASLSGFGFLAGCAIALATARITDRLLFKTSTVDPLSMIATCGILLVVVGLAAVIPARRAASLNPTVALRTE
jgi:predicted permease